MSTALIIGANRGIGLEIARIYADRGARVIAACRTASPALKALGVDIEADVDVTDDDIGGLPGRLGDTRLDVLVHNAGILRNETLGALDLDSIRRQLEVNALGPLKTVAALRGHLAPGARVGLVTSRMGSIEDNTSGGRYGYRMSKAALNMAGVSLARDLRPAGVAVALLHPGFVQTDMTGGAGDVGPAEAARGLVARIDALNLESSGGFWHAKGQRLPW